MSDPKPKGSDLADTVIATAKRHVFDPDELTWMVKRHPIAVVVVNEKFEIEIVNDRITLLSGYHESELLGQVVEILVPDVKKEAHVGHRSKYKHDPKPRSMGEKLDLHMRCKDGEEKPVTVVLEPKMTTRGLRVMAVILLKEETIHFTGSVVAPAPDGQTDH